jgi:uncharacterized protein YyaL (SSP411 family)
MLYDNALLASVYLDTYLATGDARYAKVVRETLDYALRDMTDPAGGFYSTEDADSEGEEGRFYTWTPEEIEEVLGPAAADTFCRVYDVTDVGNFEGRNILNMPKTLEQCAAILQRDAGELAAELADSRAKLFAAREKRARPGRDDKVIVAWNGLMIDAMARAGAGLEESRYVEAARRAADFLLSELRDGRGRLLHTWRAGVAKLPAYLDDYASLANALVSVHEESFDEQYIDAAVRLLDLVVEEFTDPVGGFFFTAAGHEQLIARTKELTDSSTPSGNALAATALLRVGKLIGRRKFLEAAENALAAAGPVMQRAPLAAGQTLLALDHYLGPSYELALIGDFGNEQTEQAMRAMKSRFLPRCVRSARSSAANANAVASRHLDDLFTGKVSTDGEPVLYVCQDFACREPAVGLTDIESQLSQLAHDTANR